MVADALLATKLFIPAARPGRVVRPRLLARLDQSAGQKLTLISAPAGFGKTTLVSAWLEDREAFTWYSIDAGDNDPVRFLSYLVAAFRQIDQEIGQSVEVAINSPQLPSSDAAMTALINDIVTSRRAFILVLDDYHLIDNPYIHQATRFLLENQPPTLHVVIITREDPPFSLVRLRARGELAEIRADDLRFNPEEARQFLCDSMGLDLPIDVVSALEHRTEGWAAGLQMAALSLRGEPDVEAFINSFSGSDAFVIDYLTEEVLSRQPEHVQNFLLHTSILNRLVAPLCDALTGRDDSQSILETLQQENLFLIPLDNQRRYYRYHHLFRDVLRDHLERQNPTLIPALHRRAADWYAGNELLAEAIDHALKGQDYTHAAGWIEQIIEETIIRGEMMTTRRWLESLPASIIIANPRLGVYDVFQLIISGSLSRAAEHLQKIIETLGDEPSTTIVGEIEAIKAGFAATRQNVEGMLFHGQRALEHLPESSVFIRDLVNWIVGMGRQMSGDQSGVDQIQAAGVGNTFITLVSLYTLAMSSIGQGHLNQAEAQCKQLLQLFEAQEHRSALSGLASQVYGDLLRERGDLDQAEQYLLEGIQLDRQLGNPDFLIDAYVALARTKFAQGDLTEAFANIHQAAQLIRQGEVYTHTPIYVEAHRIRLLLAAGRLQEINAWLEARSQPDRETPFTLYPDLSPGMEIENFTLARILLAQGRCEELVRLVDRTVQVVGHDYPMLQVEGAIMKALAWHQADRPEEAFAALDQSLPPAQAEGFCRLFADEGQPMENLLRDYLKARQLTPDIEHYIRFLLAAITSPAAPPPPSRIESPLVEPVSDRELDVLGLVAEGFTNQEIALRLSVSLNTVKWHLYNLYSKLDVRNRTEAVTKARELGLLDS